MNEMETQRMQCMEVWGGNQAVQRTFETRGLKIRVYSQPFGRATGGGDVYFISSCASGRITRFMLADVSGHGKAASQMAEALRGLMRRNVNFIKQTRLVRAMNKQFAALSQQGGFATALVSTFFTPTQKLSFCNAGHPPPMLFQRSTGDWSVLDGDSAAQHGLANTPLGVLAEANYHQHDVRLQTGDMVLSFSDAVTEAVDGDGRQLGRAGVQRLLRQLPAAAPADLIPAIIDRLVELSPSNLRRDDATLLLCEATGGGASLKDSLLAPFRLFRPARDRTEVASSNGPSLPSPQAMARRIPSEGARP